jgi:hypothetical protein
METSKKTSKETMSQITKQKTIRLVNNQNNEITMIKVRF